MRFRRWSKRPPGELDLSCDAGRHNKRVLRLNDPDFLLSQRPLRACSGTKASRFSKLKLPNICHLTLKHKATKKTRPAVTISLQFHDVIFRRIMMAAKLREVFKKKKRKIEIRATAKTIVEKARALIKHDNP